MKNQIIFLFILLIVSLCLNYSFFKELNAQKLRQDNFIVEELDKVTNNPNSNFVAYPQIRIPTRRNFDGWKEYRFEKLGIGYYYPPSWIPTENNIYSKTFDANDIPRPLMDDESKWDISMNPVIEKSFLEIISSQESFEKFEVSQTINSWPVYFFVPKVAETDPFPDSYYMRARIITPSGSLGWSAYSGNKINSNIEILKQIVESIHTL